jgi:hypothetical protein
MNDKYFDMVKTMAMQLDTADTITLVETLVQSLSTKNLGHFDIQDVLSDLCNKHNLLTTLADEPELSHWCESVLSARDYLVVSPDKLKQLGGTYGLLTHINETIDLEVPEVSEWAQFQLVDLWRTSTNDDYGNSKPWSERI